MAPNQIPASKDNAPFGDFGDQQVVCSVDNELRCASANEMQDFPFDNFIHNAGDAGEDNNTAEGIIEGFDFDQFFTQQDGGGWDAGDLNFGDGLGAEAGTF